MVERFVRDEEAAGSNPVTPIHDRGPGTCRDRGLFMLVAPGRGVRLVNWTFRPRLELIRLKGCWLPPPGHGL